MEAMIGQAAPDGALRKVLVVEDDAGVSRMLRFVLKGAGFEVSTVITGGEALRILEQDRPHAVILDLGLPDGLGGAVLDWLRRVGEADLPAWVVMSALDREEATRRYGFLGSNFLAKPFDPSELVRMVEGRLSTRGGQSDCLGGQA